MVSALTPITALLLALSMLLGVTGVPGQENSLPAFSVTVTNAAGEEIALGATSTTEGDGAFFFDYIGKSLLLTSNAAYLDDGASTASVTMKDLFSMIQGGAPAVSQPTEDELMSVVAIIQQTLEGLPRNAFSVIDTSSHFSLRFDVDQLAAHLHTALPAAIQANAEALNSLLQKYAPLLGVSLTAEQLVQEITSLGLDTLQTGVTGSLSVSFTKDNGVLVQASCAGVQLFITMYPDGLNASLTTPDGTKYTLNTRDLKIIASLFANVPDNISSEAFSITEEQRSKDAYGRICEVTTVNLNTSVLAFNINTTIANNITGQSKAVDALLDRYRPWIALFDAEAAETVTAERLAAAFRRGVVSLPAAVGTLTIRYYPTTYSYEVEGFMSNVSLKGTVYASSRETSGTFALTYSHFRDPLVLTADFHTDDDVTTLSLHSNELLLGLFRTLTWSYVDDFYLNWGLTTDTDAFHLTYSEEEQRITAKAGMLNFSLSEDENDVWHVDLNTPEFFASLHADEDNEFLQFDSTLLGFDYAETYYGTRINGYLAPDGYRYRALDFGIDFDEDASLLTAYLKNGRDVNYELSFAPGVVTFLADDDVYTLAPLYTHPGYATLARNGDVEWTIRFDEVVNDQVLLTFSFYEELEIDGDPAFTVVINSEPDAVALPADATPVSPEDFMQYLADFID